MRLPVRADLRAGLGRFVEVRFWVFADGETLVSVCYDRTFKVWKKGDMTAVQDEIMVPGVPLSCVSALRHTVP